jgi:hypothetical protein
MSQTWTLWILTLRAANYTTACIKHTPYSLKQLHSNVSTNNKDLQETVHNLRPTYLAWMFEMQKL